MSAREWREHWRVVRQLASGGQGHTFLVQPVTPDLPPDARFVLKVLKDQRTPERRERMYQEVANLRVLDHPGVARLVESNADLFATDADLYLVTQFIEGPDLAGYTKDGPVAVDIACACALRILDTLQYCHRKNVLHRDLKPSNVLISGGRPDQPVLVDFGLSFNSDTRSSHFQTDSAQHIGNRFIMLPEYHTRDADKRVDVSDIAQCVGLLFFMLTGRAPESLTDAQGHQPHERSVPQQALEVLPSPQREQASRIFSVGFSPELDRRWQSIDALRDEIRRLDERPAQSTHITFERRLFLVRESVSRNGTITRRAQAEQLMTATSKHLHHLATTLYQSMPDLMTMGLGGSSVDLATGTMLQNGELRPKHYPERRTSIQFSAVLENTEFAVYATMGKAKEQIARVGLFDPQAPGLLRTSMESFLASAIDHLLRP